MCSVICTLFEGDYHFGLAALVNSLYAQGYRGSVYAGYRGALPQWALAAKDAPSLNWKGGKTMAINEDIEIQFLPLETDYHLTNYKPDFMLDLLQGPAKSATNIFYFDPDIVITRSWQVYEDWVKNNGIAICEDINSPLSKNHPRRMAWRKYLETFDINLEFKFNYYINGGFLGLSKNEIEFLRVWKNIQEIIALTIGGLSKSSLNGNELPEAFDATDQDALNCALEAWHGFSISVLGKDGMGFIPGRPYMAHALGRPKPWQRNSFLQSFAGIPPKFPVKEYWKTVNGPIFPHKVFSLYINNFAVKFGAAVGRFYRRV